MIKQKGFVLTLVSINVLLLLLYLYLYLHSINDYNTIKYKLFEEYNQNYFQHYKQFYEDKNNGSCLLSWNPEENNINEQLEAVSHFLKARTTTQQIFNYISVAINKTNGVLNDPMKNEMIEHVSNIKNMIQLELEKASESLLVEDFRKYHLNLISRQIQSKIYHLQNPPTEFCQIVPKLICRLNFPNGFGSSIHDVLWCLVSAYHSNQTVILYVYSDRYIESNSMWNDVFIPLSSTCSYDQLSRFRRTEVYTVNTAFERTSVNYLPKDIGPKLVKLIEDPIPWFHGQFLGHFLRPQKKLKGFLEKMKRQLNYNHPIVGIHVRRSDKLVEESSFHSLSEYMIHVKDFYQKMSLSQNVNRRLVYVASDDPTVLPSLIKQYPDYEFIGSTSRAKMASSQSTRYSNPSLWGVLTDVFLLAESDYIVCTLSSAICKVSLELKHYMEGDASFKYQSLDIPYNYYFSLMPVRIAAYNHKPISSNEWNLKIGDRLHDRIDAKKPVVSSWYYEAAYGRGWDSFFYATNTTTNQTHYKLYPHYKGHLKGIDPQLTTIRIKLNSNAIEGHSKTI